MRGLREDPALKMGVTMGIERIFITRHGEAESNRRRIFGRPETGLTERGLVQAKHLSEYLADKGIGLIYSGNLKRQLQTTEVILKAIPAEHRITPDLNERYWGELIGKSYGESGINPDPVDVFLHTLYFSDFPTAETKEQISKRVIRVRDEIILPNKDKGLLLVSSGFTVSFLVNALLGNKELEYYRQSNCSVCEFTLEEGLFRPVNINYTGFMPKNL